MKSLFIVSLFILLSSVAFCESKIDSALQKKIKIMFKEDQKWRRESLNLENGKKTSFDEATINKNMSRTDSLNMIEAKIIIKKYGFPSYSLVGEDGSDWFWAIVQHCDQDLIFQQKGLVLMTEEVKKHNATGENLALLQDGVLVNSYTGHKSV